jgi:two-component system, cell cycle response regulator
MLSENIHILLVEDNLEYAQVLQGLLSMAGPVHYELVHFTTLGEALKVFTEKVFHLVLLDLFLPDCGGYETFLRAREHAPDIPIVVLTAREDETLAVQAVRHGAQDYLVKGQINNKLLLRSLRYAIERQRGQARLEHLTLIDDLTGLYNRRGFISYGKKYVKLSQRTKKGFMVLFADMDGLKSINDTLGHNTGDEALIDTAEILRKTFRESDIIARLGGDEFAVLAMDISSFNGVSSLLLTRLQENLKDLNAQPHRSYLVSISVGIALYKPGSLNTLEELIDEADARMYEQKREKKKLALSG